MYKFRNVQDLETFLLDSLGVDLIIPSAAPDEITFFSNGDKMTVNTSIGKLLWEPIKPGDMFTSKLSVRFHSWWGKGIIVKDE